MIHEDLNFECNRGLHNDPWFFGLNLSQEFDQLLICKLTGVGFRWLAILALETFSFALACVLSCSDIELESVSIVLAEELVSNSGILLFFFLRLNFTSTQMLLMEVENRHWRLVNFSSL